MQPHAAAKKKREQRPYSTAKLYEILEYPEDTLVVAGQLMVLLASAAQLKQRQGGAPEFAVVSYDGRLDTIPHHTTPTGSPTLLSQLLAEASITSPKADSSGRLSASQQKDSRSSKRPLSKVAARNGVRFAAVARYLHDVEGVKFKIPANFTEQWLESAKHGSSAKLTTGAAVHIGHCLYGAWVKPGMSRSLEQAIKNFDALSVDNVRVTKESVGGGVTGGGGAAGDGSSEAALDEPASASGAVMQRTKKVATSKRFAGRDRLTNANAPYYSLVFGPVTEGGTEFTVPISSLPQDMLDRKSSTTIDLQLGAAGELQPRRAATLPPLPAPWNTPGLSWYDLWVLFGKAAQLGLLAGDKETVSSMQFPDSIDLTAVTLGQVSPSAKASFAVAVPGVRSKQRGKRKAALAKRTAAPPPADKPSQPPADILDLAAGDDDSSGSVSNVASRVGASEMPNSAPSIRRDIQLALADTASTISHQGSAVFVGEPDRCSSSSMRSSSSSSSGFNLDSELRRRDKAAAAARDEAKTQAAKIAASAASSSAPNPTPPHTLDVSAVSAGAASHVSSSGRGSKRRREEERASSAIRSRLGLGTTTSGKVRALVARQHGAASAAGSASVLSRNTENANSLLEQESLETMKSMAAAADSMRTYLDAKRKQSATAAAARKAARDAASAQQKKSAPTAIHDPAAIVASAPRWGPQEIGAVVLNLETITSSLRSANTGSAAGLLWGRSAWSHAQTTLETVIEDVYTSEVAGTHVQIDAPLRAAMLCFNDAKMKRLNSSALRHTALAHFMHLLFPHCKCSTCSEMYKDVADLCTGTGSSLPRWLAEK